MGPVLLVGVAMLVANSRDGSIVYHKWRLGVAIQHARTAGAGKPTKKQELLALLRGKPVNSEDCFAVWRRHEEALVRLNYLVRREFAVHTRPDTEERVRIAQAAERVFQQPQLWSIATNPANDFAVIITAPPQDMPKWERLMSRLRKESEFARGSNPLSQRLAL